MEISPKLQLKISSCLLMVLGRRDLIILIETVLTLDLLYLQSIINKDGILIPKRHSGTSLHSLEVCFTVISLKS